MPPTILGMLLHLWSLALTLVPAYLFYTMLNLLNTLPSIGSLAQTMLDLAYKNIENGIGFELPLLLIPPALETARYIFLIPYHIMQIIPLGAWGFEILAKVCYHPRLDVPELSRFCAVIWLAGLFFWDLICACWGLTDDPGLLVGLQAVWEIVAFLGWVLARCGDDGERALRVVDGWVANAFAWVDGMEEIEGGNERL